MNHLKSFWYLILIFLIYLNCASTLFASEDLYPFHSSSDATRFSSLTKEIRCVVCQNQNLAESNAPLANDLRNKIYYMVLAKQSNSEIESYLVKRYGEFILLKPRFNITTFMLWIFPFAAILISLYRFYMLR
ncbi:MAG: hypothetical protein A3F11_05440 [Gammaproteobacteria bacterium RIFCSPHIGHO2_12_FULL_37_14]|nr:MAG: hypothetical protein A3F11_05440 [Gammaproteobacteria bacterium RIFCSPHIGHO2_12_FULL_37_14]